MTRGLRIDGTPLLTCRSTRRRTALRLAAAAALSLPAAASLGQQQLTFYADGQSAGGYGLWNTTQPNWFNGTSFVPFTAADSAVLPGNGALGLTTAITANSLTFTGNAVIYAPPAGGYFASSPALTVTSGVIDTGAGTVQNSLNIAGTSGITKNGSGVLIYQGNLGTSTSTAPITVNAGTLAPGNSAFTAIPATRSR